MEIIYQDKDIIVCVKPPRVLSTDEPGGVPELVRQALGDPNANVRTVHRLDRTVSGLMVLARRSKAASELSRQIREGLFQKEYLAVVHGAPEEEKPAATAEDAKIRVEQLMESGMSRKDAVKQVALELDLPKNVVYDAALK